ncbi:MULTISPECIES: SIP domain-containing protein [Bacteria]|uniref:SIP domain-containing protein n=1 Tax=Bacteria TaxID=2 RepID=UPI003C79AD54
MTRTALTPTPRAQRRASRRPRVQHLIAADESGLAELEAVLATLPICAVGRVFIEVADPSDVSRIDVPPRMTVTWLPRAARTGAPGSGRRCGAGEALTRAVTAWADEMLCGEEALPTQITLLAGYLGTADIVDHLLDRGMRPETIDAPARYGLLPTR